MTESKNTSRPPPPYTTTVSPQDTPWTPTSLIKYTRRLTATPGPSRRPCSYVYRTPTSTGTWESTSYCTYGTISSRHLQPCSASQPSQPLLHNTPYWFPQPFSCSPTHPLPLSIMAGGTQLSFMFFTYVKYTCILNTPLSLSTTSPTPVPSW